MCLVPGIELGTFCVPGNHWGEAEPGDTRLAKKQAAQLEASPSLFLLGNPTYLTWYLTPKILLPAPTEHLRQAKCRADAETPPRAHCLFVEGLPIHPVWYLILTATDRRHTLSLYPSITPCVHLFKTIHTEYSTYVRS